jgi:hypothetical protein
MANQRQQRGFKVLEGVVSFSPFIRQKDHRANERDMIVRLQIHLLIKWEYGASSICSLHIDTL